MESFPEELLISIFSYLTTPDIISLSLSYKRFSEVISCSSQLINILTAKFSKATANSEWIGSRKYMNVSISDGGVEKFLDIQEIFDLPVRKLSISIKDLNMSGFIKILEICPKLKDLEITEKSGDDRIFRSEQLPCLKLEKLKIRGGLKSLKILRKSQTKELHVYWSPRSYPSECKLAEFLVTQNNLKILKLENFSEYSFEFPQNLIQNVRFWLERLTVKNCSDLYILRLKNFMDLHIISLKYIELDSYGHRESKLLQPFDKLNTLKFNGEHLKINGPVSPTDMIFSLLSGANQFPDPFYFIVSPLPQIRTLKILNLDKDFVNFSEYFPKIENLIIYGHGNSFFVDVENFDELKILEIYSKNLTKSFKIPKKLKKLKLVVDHFPKNEEPFNGYDENQIEEITLGGECDLNWIKIFIKYGSNNLKVFKTVGKKIDQELRFMLEKSSNTRVVEYCSSDKCD